MRCGAFVIGYERDIIFKFRKHIINIKLGGAQDIAVVLLYHGTVVGIEPCVFFNRLVLIGIGYVVFKEKPFFARVLTVISFNSILCVKRILLFAVKPGSALVGGFD